MPMNIIAVSIRLVRDISHACNGRTGICEKDVEHESSHTAHAGGQISGALPPGARVLGAKVTRRQMSSYKRPQRVLESAPHRQMQGRAGGGTALPHRKGTYQRIRVCVHVPRVILVWISARRLLFSTRAMFFVWTPSSAHEVGLNQSRGVTHSGIHTGIT